MTNGRQRSSRALSAVLCGLALAISTADPAAADSIRNQQWSLEYLKAAELATVSQGEGVTVAVVDTGVDANHPDLTGSVLKGLDASREPDGRTDDFTGHGTAMASLIAGHGHGRGNADGVLGIAPKAKILPVRVGPRTGNGHPDELANGILAAVEAGAKVICVAAAGGATDNLQAAMAYGLYKGAIIIAGVGNTSDVPEIAWPAAYPGVVAVAGVQRDGTISTISAKGNYGGKITLAAPSDDIVSARLKGGYDTSTGTSNATALVAGVAAVIKAKYPQETPAGILQRLRDSAVDRGDPGYDERYGYGVIDPLAATAATVPKRAGASASPSPGSSRSPRVAASPRAEPSAEAPKAVQIAALMLAFLAIPVVLGLLTMWFRRRMRRRSQPAAADQWQPTRLPAIGERPDPNHDPYA
ncbi:S8 family serine peptidase [Dactylosporangium siamense]|uniref:Type VII secretion-associated serine protease n=1 Tax=Dactylosporangium siamense TaxID=685454 RepID=A0A919UCJ4_9ACTN|nr:S8 family serine peptidase [Dactylosporangium siamense]GIG46660.1 type VII secretion-associated serine protease [Dactylosporangium siamense]